MIKRKHIIYLLSLFVLFFNAHAQKDTNRKETKINLIKERVLAAKNDSIKIILLKEWADIAFISNYGEDLWLQN